MKLGSFVQVPGGVGVGAVTGAGTGAVTGAGTGAVTGGGVIGEVGVAIPPPQIQHAVLAVPLPASQQLPKLEQSGSFASYHEQSSP